MTADKKTVTKIIPEIQDVISAVDKLGYKLTRDEHNGSVQILYPLAEDYVQAESGYDTHIRNIIQVSTRVDKNHPELGQLALELSRYNWSNRTLFKEALEYMADCGIKISRPKEYFNNVCGPFYDANPLDYFKMFMDSITFKEGVSREYMEQIFRTFFIGIARNLFSSNPEHQNIILVLEGAQGIGKTVLLTKIFKDIPEFFVSAGIDKDNVDFKIMLSNNLMWNIDEIDAVSGKELDILKRVTSRKSNTYRCPYAPLPKPFAQIASICGTTNDPDFLTDQTGNRRFGVAPILSIDWKGYNAIPKQGLLGQMLRQGQACNWEYDFIDKELQQQANLTHQVEHAYRSFFERHVIKKPGGRIFISDLTLLGQLARLYFVQGRRESKEVSAAMRALGHTMVHSIRRLGTNHSPTKGYLDLALTDEAKAILGKSYDPFEHGDL